MSAIAGAPPQMPAIGWKRTLGAYFALTKPRIIELLLVTTFPAMVVAADGMPDLWIALATLVGGALAAGGANTINCYIDRDIDAIMKRTHHRPLPEGLVTPEPGADLRHQPQRDLLRLPDAVGEPADGDAGPERDPVLRLRLHDLAQALDGGEHRHRRRCRVGAAAVRLGRRHGQPGRRAADHVRGDLPLDAAALLGPGHPLHGATTPTAHVPMLPVTRGAREATRRSLVYAIVTVFVSLTLYLTGDVGLVYLAIAAVLGAGLVWLAIRQIQLATCRGGVDAVQVLDDVPGALVRRHGYR